MSVTFSTTKPQDLLDAFRKRVNQEEQKGKITTWEENSKKFFTHKASQVARQAYMWPTISDNSLVFTIHAPEGKPISDYVYAFYHGHLTETFITHFKDLFSSASSTAKAAAKDNVKGVYKS